MTRGVLALAIGYALTGLALAGEPLKPVLFTDVHIEDAFWAPRLETNRKVTLPHNLKMCAETGRLRNFRVAAGLEKGKYEGRFYNDSDVYKVIEGAAYALAQQPDAELAARIDSIIDDIAAAQQPDGYMNAYYTVTGLDKRWTDLNTMHELYCAGHMFEAAVAYSQATGKDKLLGVARRMADHIDGIFGPGKRIGWPGHEEVELALIKLYRHTGEQRYAKLAKYFIDVRGTTLLENDKTPEYRQAHKPIKQQTEIVGHSVRALYMLSGVADVCSYSPDADYLHMMDTIWHSVVDRKLYITGGAGARHSGEAFGDDYELPNDTAYCETCAAIGLALWNQRMLNLQADAKYADVIERAIFNAILAGVSLKGDTFFYVNPLSSTGKHHRRPWFNTACCPTNIVRFIPSIGGYMYSTDKTGLYVHQYIAGTAKVALPSGKAVVRQKTEYPWSGDVTLTLDLEKPAGFDVHLRIPGWWCRTPRIKVAGQVVNDAVMANGYAVLHRDWKPGDAIELSMPMPIERVYAHPRVAADSGRVALQRGPIVYCAEAVDNHGQVGNLVLPRDAELKTAKQPDLLGGITTIRAEGLAVEPVDWAGKLYVPMPAARKVEIAAIPYYAWDQREPGEMAVWLAESIGLAATRPAP